MYPIYKWGWKFLWLLPTYIIATEVWVFVAAMQRNLKGSRLLMFAFDVLKQCSAETNFCSFMPGRQMWVKRLPLTFIFRLTFDAARG